MEPSYVILTESSSDLTPELAERAGVEILPMPFTMEGVSYLHSPDWQAMSPEDFYGKLRGGVVSTTAALNAAVLTEAMEGHLKAGQDVLFLCFTSGLSSTRDTCALAAEELREQYPDRTIETVDTLSAAIGQGLLVLLAGERRKAGASLGEVRDYVEGTRLHIAHWFMVDDLGFLKRGGRVSSTAAAVGSMLQIKPVLRVDNAGCLAVAEKARGRKGAVQALLRHMEETAVRPVETVLVGHADALAEAEALAEQIRVRFSPRDVFIVPQGPVIGTHTGPGFLAVTFLAEHR